MKDVTQHSERVVHISEKRAERIAVIWYYAYYRIPITKILLTPELQRRDTSAELPSVANVEIVIEPNTGRKIGVVFDVDTHGVVESWICNLSVEAEYVSEKMGRRYKHRRPADFIISSQRDITEVLESLDV